MFQFRLIFTFVNLSYLAGTLCMVIRDKFMRVDDMILFRPEHRAGLSSPEFRWPDGEIPYQIEEGLSKKQLELLQKAMESLEESTCIEFVRRSNEENYLEIGHRDEGCYAHVGYMNHGAQKVNLGKGCWKFGTVVHELIHSIGFSHTHQRNDRDKYVTILYENLNPVMRHNFMLDNEMGMSFDHFGLPYNFDSVMHYGRLAFSRNGKVTILPRKVWNIIYPVAYEEIDEHGRPVIGQNGISRGDIEMINRMYDDDYC